MKKKFLALLLCLAVAVSAAVPAFAAAAKTVVYDGTTITTGTGMDGFTNMIPGMTSTDSLTLVNSSSDTVKYYMYMDVVDTLKNANSAGAAYDVLLTCGGDTLYGYDHLTQTASGTLIGGTGTAELKELNGLFGSEKAVLVATLAPGESAVLTLTITPDATGLNNNYQNALGQINFRFGVENVRAGTTTIVTERNVVKTVKTGDTNDFVLIGGAAAAALVVLVVVSRRKKKEEKR